VPKYLRAVERLKINRYKQVIIAAKFARALNDQLRKEREPWQAEGMQEEKKDAPVSSRIAEEALEALAHGEIEYED
jgi:hypothetical protein